MQWWLPGTTLAASIMLGSCLLACCLARIMVRPSRTPATSDEEEDAQELWYQGAMHAEEPAATQTIWQGAVCVEQPSGEFMLAKLADTSHQAPM